MLHALQIRARWHSTAGLLIRGCGVLGDSVFRLITQCDSEGSGVPNRDNIHASSPERQWIPTSVASPQWYAIHTRSQHEKSVAAHLESQGITTFLPLVTKIHRWSDRQKLVRLPLFSCYTFVHMSFAPELWVKVMGVSGVLSFVGIRGQGVPIPEKQMEGIRAILARNAPYTLCPFLNVGQHVRIRGGALDGIEGILVARNGDRTVVISVEPIQRSLAVRIGDYHVEPL
jgi:transcription antitermination factor NusG